MQFSLPKGGGHTSIHLTNQDQISRKIELLKIQTPQKLSNRKIHSPQKLVLQDLHISADY